MSNLALLRVMVLKEMRTTFREQNQMRGLVISLLLLMVAVGGSISTAMHAGRQAREMRMLKPPTAPGPPAAMTQRAETQERPALTLPAEDVEEAMGHRPEISRVPPPPPVLIWLATGGPALVGFFFSLGYLISAVLASFVGEKEGRTLEILLASPLSDRKLFLVKCISVLLPSSAVAYGVGALLAVLGFIFVPSDVMALPASLLFNALVLSLPLTLLSQVALVGLGAAISIRAETLKGAAQVLSAVIMIVIFGGVYGIPLLARANPAFGDWLLGVIAWWFERPFGGQYALVVAVLGLLALLMMVVARGMFRRDRMLT